MLDATVDFSLKRQRKRWVTHQITVSSSQLTTVASWCNPEV
jgi:hypothetical protein